MKNNGKVLSIILACIGVIMLSTGMILILFTEQGTNNIYNSSEDDKNNITNKIDVVSSSLWTGNDGSYLYLYSDNKFIWYQSGTNLHDNYYSGTYQVYNGDSAIKYIDKNLKKYGVTKKEQETLIDEYEDNVNGDAKDYYYLLILNNEYLVSNGVKKDLKNISPYYGFYYESLKYLDFVNMNTANYAGFTNVKKLNGNVV